MQKEDKFAFGFMDLPKRSKKPREVGITMLEGDAMMCIMGPRSLRDLIEWAEEWIDWFKFLASTIMFQKKQHVIEKFDILKENGIVPFPGGMLVETAIMQNKVEPLLNELKNMGCTGLEISDSLISLTVEQKIKMIELAKGYGFRVLVEVGKKDPKAPISSSEVIRQMEEYLAAGAEKLVFEMDEVEALFEKGNSSKEAMEGARVLLEIAHSVGHRNIIFEVPLLDYLTVKPIWWWFVNNLGPDVNLGNVNPNHILALEITRRGLATIGWGKIFTPILDEK
jgi:phosphosulfolactate synthase